MKIILETTIVTKGTAGANDKVNAGKLVISETTKDEEVQFEIGTTSLSYDVRVNPWEILRGLKALGYVDWEE